MRSAGWTSLAGCGGIWTAAVGKVGASSSHSQPRAVGGPPTVASGPSCPALPATHTPGPHPSQLVPIKPFQVAVPPCPLSSLPPSGHRAQLRAWSCCLGLSGAPKLGLE